MKTNKITRRKFVAQSARLAAGTIAATHLTPVAAFAAATPLTGDTRQATGVKVGEVTENSAIVWMRLTASTTRNQNGEVIKGHVKAKADARPTPTTTSQLEGACPGAEGTARLRYGTREDLSDAKATDWITTTSKSDFAGQFRLAGLKPGTVYYYSAETSDKAGSPKHGALHGRFETAPAHNQAAPVKFCVITCQMYADLDHQDGFHIYPAMAKLNPQFIAFMGDNVYYDSEEPKAVSPALARYHWERMYSLPRHVDLIRSVSSYWAKDDHDTLDNDSWPGRKMGELTWAQGQEIFRQQVPMGELTYRTFRWGKSLQVWITEGRDFRSPNNKKDGPEKTIWGAEQKEWFKRTVKESDATWKVLISPTPLVGPDRGNKNDNHANTGFTHEGDEIRGWIKENAPDNLFVVCGDRHWQYHSQHPKTGLNEFSVGAASDEHAGGSPGKDDEYHRFHRVKGGFVSVALDTANGKSRIAFEHRDVHGAVIYEWKKEAARV